MIIASESQGFSEAVDIFGRATSATNYILDNWWIFPLLFLAIWLYRRLRNGHAMIGKLDERCSAAFGDIDAFLLERHALISNLTETVKGFAIQESTVFKDIIEARAMAMTSTGQVKLEAENQIGQSLTNLFQLTESYPELESSNHFRELRQEMVRIEGRITAARRFYNLSVEEYNSLCRAFPANIWSKLATTRTYEKFSLGEIRAQLSDPVQISFSPSHQAG